jgi:hypothetical protein
MGVGRGGVGLRWRGGRLRGEVMAVLIILPLVGRCRLHYLLHARRLLVLSSRGTWRSQDHSHKVVRKHVAHIKLSHPQ